MTELQMECFVISPIGQPASKVRKHADAVLSDIIEPAMATFGIKTVRSDRVSESGRITDQMFRYLHSSHLCIAILTDYNPNVLYELAIAQSANRPVIILIREGKELPFDLKDLRCIGYDLEVGFQQKTAVRQAS